MKTENRRIFWILGLIVLFVLLMVAANISSSKKSKDVVEDVKTLLNSETAKAIYLYRESDDENKDCGWCRLNAYNMKVMVKEYGFEYYGINTNDLSSADLDAILSILKVEDFGTPYLTVVKGGEVVDTLNGVVGFDEFFKFLKTNKLIASDAKLYLNYISYSDYKKLIKSDSNEVIVLATTSCTYCLAEQQVLIDVAKETGAKINIFYLNKNLTEEKVYNEFMSSLTWFSENTKWGTPTTLVVKNGKVVNTLDGYREAEAIKTFYKDNGIIK